MPAHTFSSITRAKGKMSVSQRGRKSLFLYGRMYRMGYGNGDPIAGGGLGEIACLCAPAHTHRRRGVSRGGISCCTFSGQACGLFILFFFLLLSACFCHRGVFVTLFDVVDILLRSANCRSAFNEPKRRCNEPRRSTRPPCRRSIHTTPSTWKTCKKCLTSASKWRPNDSLSSKKFSSISTKDWISVRIQREFDMSRWGCPLYYYPRNPSGAASGSIQLSMIDRYRFTSRGLILFGQGNLIQATPTASCFCVAGLVFFRFFFPR